MLRRWLRTLVSDPFRLHPFAYPAFVFLLAAAIVAVAVNGFGDAKTAPVPTPATTTGVPLYKECQNFGKYAGSSEDSQTMLAELCARGADQ